MCKQTVSGPMLLSKRASLRGRQTKSPLQTGAVSTEYVCLDLAVMSCVSDESSRPESALSTKRSVPG